MPALDLCITDVFESGNIPGSAGTTPSVPTLPTTVDPDDYDPNSLTYSLDFSKFYNSMYQGSIV